jgi:hypothetical protein
MMMMMMMMMIIMICEQGGTMVGVGLGLSLHSSMPGMVVTEVAAWCQVIYIYIYIYIKYTLYGTLYRAVYIVNHIHSVLM